MTARSDPSVAGVILAAGTASRLGRPKQLLLLGGRPILQHVIDAASAGGLAELVVVVGHEADRVVEAISLPPRGRAVVNPEFAGGQSSSLRAGLRALGAGPRAGVVLLGDQPGVSAEVIRDVTAAHARGGGPIVQARYAGRWGHPVLLDRSVWAEAEGVEGDRGARDVLARHPEWVTAVDVDGDPPEDIDTWADYERLRDRGER